jgi:hypothetical protein
MCVIVLIRRTSNDDTIMRGILAHLAMKEMRDCSSSLLTVGWYAELPQLNHSLSVAFATAPSPHVCYFLKEAWGPEPDLCHHAGAYTVFDVIDNDKRAGIFPGSHIFKSQLLAVKPFIDLHLVNTEYHAAYLRSVGVYAEAFPHPHSNFGVFGPDRANAMDFTRVGLMAGQVANMPDNATLGRLGFQTCQAGMQLTLIISGRSGPQRLTCPSQFCPNLNCTKRQLPRHRARSWASRSSPRTRAHVVRGTQTAPDECARFVPRPLAPEATDERDAERLNAMLQRSPTVQRQQTFYDWRQRALPALAIVWEATALYGTSLHFFASNRPQTRQLWWWTLGVPTIGSAGVLSARELGSKVGLQALHELNWLPDVRSALSCIQMVPGMYDEMRARVLNHSQHHGTVLASMRQLRDMVYALHNRTGGVVPPPKGDFLPYFKHKRDIPNERLVKHAFKDE